MKPGTVSIGIVAIAMGLWGLTFSWARWGIGNPTAIISRLEWLSPAACAISMLAVPIAAIACRANVLHLVRLLGRRDWLSLTVVIVMTLLVRIVTVPAIERIYYDEHTYRQIALGIADEGRTRVASYGVIGQQRYRCQIGSYPHWSSGWPTLFAAAMRLTGYARWTGPTVNLILSLATAVLVSLTAVSLFAGTHVWLMSSLVFTCLPANQVWSRTSASEVFAVFAATLAVLCAVRFAQSPIRRLGYLLAASVAMAVQVRNEMLLVAPICVVFVGCLGGRPALKAACWPAAFLAAFLVPQGLHLGWVSRGYEPGLVEGAGFGVRYFPSNIESVGHYLRQDPVASVCLIVAFVGVSRSRTGRATVPLWVWGLSAFGLPMFYFAGSYAFPGGERFFLACLPVVALGAGAGFYALYLTLGRHLSLPILITALLALFVGALSLGGPQAAHVDRKTLIPRADCAFLRTALRSVPDDGMVITADPPAVIAEGHSAVLITWAGRNVQRLRGLVGRYPYALYFFVSPSSSPSQWPGGEECEKRLLSMFRASVVRYQSAPEGLRILYRLLPLGATRRIPAPR